MTPISSTQTFVGMMQGVCAYTLRITCVIMPIGVITPFALSIADEGLTPQLMLILGLLVLPVGIALPLMLWSAHVRVQITPYMFRAGFWPLSVFGLIFKRSVPWANVSQVERRTISSFWDYGGYGVKGTPNDVLYSVGGTEAVTVHYHYANKGRERMVTVTTPDADALYEACLTHTNQP